MMFGRLGWKGSRTRPQKESGMGLQMKLLSLFLLLDLLSYLKIRALLLGPFNRLQIKDKSGRVKTYGLFGLQDCRSRHTGQVGPFTKSVETVLGLVQHDTQAPYKGQSTSQGHKNRAYFRFWGRDVQFVQDLVL